MKICSLLHPFLPKVACMFYLALLMFHSNWSLELVLEIKILATRPNQLKFIALQRKSSQGMFGNDNSQDQTNAALEGVWFVLCSQGS